MASVIQMMETAKTVSPVHKLNPLAKALWLFCIIIIPIITFNPFVTLPIIVIIWLLAIPAKIKKTFYPNLLKTYPVLIGFIVILWPFFYREGTHLLVNLGFAQITLEGVYFALAQGLRIAVAVTGCLFFIMVTDVMDFASAMGAMLQRRFKISFTIPMMLISSFKFLPEFMTSFDAIRQAFLTRGFELDKGGLGERIKKFVPLFIPLIDTTLNKAQHIATAMQLKAFGIRKERVFFVEYKVKTADYLFILLGFLIVAFAAWADSIPLGGFSL